MVVLTPLLKSRLEDGKGVPVVAVTSVKQVMTPLLKSRWSMMNDIPLILQWSNYLKALHNLNGEELAMYNDEAHNTYDITLLAKRQEFLNTLKGKH